ncbi:MAG: hypothetical protein KAI53_01930 [Candidatus Aenigmarchaeota archaeon]|nr:hypothetical protein [Candidatus Aenigmarchaeota archaeon]
MIKNDISAQISAIIGIFPRGKKKTAIHPLYHTPQNINPEYLCIPYNNRFYGFEPIDKDKLSDDKNWLIYKPGDKVRLQHYMYYVGDVNEYNNANSLCSELFLKCEMDKALWREKANDYGAKITTSSYDFYDEAESDMDEIQIHEFECTPLNGLLNDQAFGLMSTGAAVSATFSDIARKYSEGNGVSGFDPFNSLNAILHSNGICIFDLEIPVEYISIPQEKITTCGGVKRNDGLIFPEGINIDTKNIENYGHFIHQNPEENEILFTPYIPMNYVTGFRYFPHNRAVIAGFVNLKKELLTIANS